MEGQLPNTKQWVVFYSVYINSKKTVAEGRRINLSKACENPTCVEIGDCCNHLKLPLLLRFVYAFVLHVSLILSSFDSGDDELQR
ncbi:hypothetical protein SLEP1_g56587 [Rubroshorea leprosula]|uniref:Uncharacterized protein n=1 Tax=Rubroshorea leprosula TaxID=152421 RepID=A0AAV5MIY0_9ROSI|nr:hypothetical protein SLEP1_g56587 [Rubroshorea leprosula]